MGGIGCEDSESKGFGKELEGGIVQEQDVGAKVAVMVFSGHNCPQFFVWGYGNGIESGLQRIESTLESRSLLG